MSNKFGLLFIQFCILFKVNFLNFKVFLGQLITEFNLMKKHDLLFRLGSFGKVPYGKKIQGRSWYLKDQNDDFYDACEVEKMKPIDFKPYLKEHEAPVVLVDVGSCRLSRKAQNVEFIGGKLMLLVTRNEQLIDELNYDDSFAQVISIPTVIITKSLGDKIKEQLSNGVSYTPTFDFNIERFNQVQIHYYFSSNNHLGVNFFSEFYSFKEILGNHLIFQPFYKTYNMSNFNIKDSKIYGCIDSNNFYCSKKYLEADANTILEENIRESCLHNISNDKYWTYMRQFDNKCQNLSSPNFTRECATNIMTEIDVNINIIDNCLNQVKNDPDNSVLKRDAELYKKEKVFKIPEIRINKEIYKGSWNSKFIFEAICSGLKDGDAICQNTSNSGWSPVLVVIVITILISVIGFIGVISYKKMINRKIDSLIIEKIEAQSINSIGEFMKFQESSRMKESLIVS